MSTLLKLYDGPIRALSLRQPWLFAIFNLEKRIENRVWDCSYRGPIWLHAAKGMTVQECADAVDWMSDRGLMNWFKEELWPGTAGLERGGVCGYAEIKGVLLPEGRQTEFGLDSFRRDFPGKADEMRRWHMDGHYGFVLENVRRFPLMPCAGRQRWFYLPQNVERAARAALEKAA
jgi:hypothetical protein